MVSPRPGSKCTAAVNNVTISAADAGGLAVRKAVPGGGENEHQDLLDHTLNLLGRDGGLAFLIGVPGAPGGLEFLYSFNHENKEARLRMGESPDRPSCNDGLAQGCPMYNACNLKDFYTIIVIVLLKISKDYSRLRPAGLPAGGVSPGWIVPQNSPWHIRKPPPHISEVHGILCPGHAAIVRQKKSGYFGVRTLTSLVTNLKKLTQILPSLARPPRKKTHGSL